MKKIILILLVIFSLFIFTVPAYAETCHDCDKKIYCETCGQKLPKNEICETCGQGIKEENIETKPVEIHDLFNIDTPLKGFIFGFSIFFFLFIVCYLTAICD